MYAFIGVTLFTGGVRGFWSGTRLSMATPAFMFDTTSTWIGRLPAVRPISISSARAGYGAATCRR